MTRLDDITSVVLAPNPSPMTLEGTNTYLIGAPGAGGVVVVDPGPDLPGHRKAVDGACADLDAEVAAVVLTHHHPDHAEAAGWAQSWGAPLHAFDPTLISAPAAPLGDAEALRTAGVELEPVHTPGHASDHLCLRVRGTDALLTGDHILGRGTTVVTWPDGDMAAYMASLERVGALGASALYPGHGPTVTDPAAKVREYIDHRLEREQQVLDALAAGDGTPAEIVVRVYADVDPVLHPAAQASVRAHLDKLAADGKVTREGEVWRV
jgi:glyoxylase-like metal-dependent hydrolase (beta-lactamase superfamily II)